MGLDSIWNHEGNYLKRNSKNFRARSTGCDCCSVKLENKEEVKKEVIDSLSEILVASEYFNLNFSDLIETAKKSKKYVEFNMN